MFKYPSACSSLSGKTLEAHKLGVDKTKSKVVATTLRLNLQTIPDYSCSCHDPDDIVSEFDSSSVQLSVNVGACATYHFLYDTI